MGKIKKRLTLPTVEFVEKELSYIADVKAKLFSYFGKQYGNVS